MRADHYARYLDEARGLAEQLDAAPPSERVEFDGALGELQYFACVAESLSGGVPAAAV